MTRRLSAQEKAERKSARFWSKVNMTDSCWLWLGFKSSTGYGRSGSSWAHRSAYELLVGPIPEGLEIDHLCRNRACVRPSHMELVTHRENQRRGDSPFGVNARKSHCKRGHEFTPENTAVRNGKRECRACHAARERARRAKQKATA